MRHWFTLLLLAAVMVACGGDKKDTADDEPQAVDAAGNAVESDSEKAVAEALPFSGEDVAEHVVMDFGNRAIRTDADVTISHPDKVKDKQKCFIVMSKKDYYLYVYEAQGSDTVMIARYDCAFGLKKGNKEGQGDMRTPHCTMAEPFSITQIVDASSWCHDFGDGRGSIKAYGNWFLRLATPGHKGIGIHGSTNNRESVPGRASEGCIRLKDEDIDNLRRNYAFEGMKVVIKGEEIDDLPFEIHALTKQKIARKRHFNAKKTLTNEQIAQAKAEQGRVASASVSNSVPLEPAVPAPKAQPEKRDNQSAVASKDSKNMTLEERQAQTK
ncbi:MAG: L,D-transpeptidase [Prevotella sp.]|nr:L,D-transpeptidase [Prevotella sp.]